MTSLTLLAGRTVVRQIKNLLCFPVMNVNSPAHEILALTAYAQSPGLNTPACVACEARPLDINLVLHPCPDCVYASSKGSGESAHMRILA